MEANGVYDKTEKGREEIATRKYQLPARLRTLLVMIDGRHPLETVLSKIGGLGLSGASVDELFEQGYIALVPGAEVVPEPVKAPVRKLPLAKRPHIPSASVQNEIAGMHEAESYATVLDFYTQTIKQVLGLRGFTLQLKVDKAATLAELAALREPYLEAIEKAKGEELARSLAERLDKLLETHPESRAA
jgi:hypothetical protein